METFLSSTRWKNTVPAVFALVFAIWGTSQTLMLRQRILHAEWADGMTGLLEHKSAVVEQIVASAEGRPFSVSQDARQPDAGIDYWLLYLYFALTGNPRIPSAPDGPLFVVRSSQTVLREQPSDFLADLEPADLGPYRVYQLTVEEAKEWRGLVSRFPAVPES